MLRFSVSDFHVNVLPDPGRINGPQTSRSSKAKKVATFPCKFQGCLHESNKRKAWRGDDGNKRANKHMREAHSGWSGLQAVLYPVTAAQEELEDVDNREGGG
jgi:hypothetical protein